MSKRNKYSLAKKLAEINSLWDNEENHSMLMPAREMFCIFDENGCFYHIETSPECAIPSDEKIFDSINLDVNTDWLQWELEMME